MATRLNAAATVVFGPFEYDALSGKLSKYGTALRLQGKPLQILLFLVNRPGEVISREELQRHLWEGTTFVDFEQGLNSAVNKLRQTLGDSADQPRYVETLTGKGYRFIAPIQPAGTNAVLEMPNPALLRIEPKQERQSRAWLWYATCASLAVIAAGSWLFTGARGATEAPKAMKFAVQAPAGFALEGAASRAAFALSPDGSRLAFTAMDSSGEFSVFLRDFSSLEPRLIPGSTGAHTLFWAPDGRSLYLTANGKFWRMSLEGTAHVLLGDSPPFMFSGVWLDSKRILLDSFRASYLVPPTGGPLERLNQIYLWPRMLPGGDNIVYVKWDERAGRYRAHVVRADDFRTTKDLFETDSRVLYSASVLNPGSGYLLYVRGGNLLAQPFDSRALRMTGDAIPVAGNVYSFAKTGAADFSVSDRGDLAYQSLVSRSQLEWVDRAGHEVASIGPNNINVKSARLSPDGQSLAAAIYDVQEGEQDLRIFDVKTNTGRRLSAEKALRDAPVWSPDSKKLAYMQQSDGNPPRVHLRGLGEQDPEEQMPAADFQVPFDWSADGRFVAFVNTGFPRSANETQGDVLVFDMARGRKAVPLLNTQFNEANPAFSPDGKWLAFTSNESGQPEVYVQAFRSGDAPALFGDRYLVSGAGALAVRWRRDGRELFYLGFDGRVQGVPVKLTTKPEFGQAQALFSISTEARAAIHSIVGFDVSANGSRFVIVKTAEAPSIVVIHNWEAMLPQKR